MKTVIVVKRYKAWHKLKSRIHNSSSTPPFYKEREIWWVSLGHNVGVEEDGKGNDFNRPVLIIRGFSRYLFWGIPLSTTKKTGIYYHPFVVNNKVSTALLSQLRVFDTRRLINKYGMVSQKDFKAIRTKIRNFIT